MTCCENTREKNHFIFKNQITFSSLPGGKAFYFGLKIEVIRLTCFLSSEISFLSSLSVCVCVCVLVYAHTEFGCQWVAHISVFAQYIHALKGSVTLKIICSLHWCLKDIYKYASMKTSHEQAKEWGRKSSLTCICNYHSCRLCYTGKL